MLLEYMWTVTCMWSHVFDGRLCFRSKLVIPHLLKSQNPHILNLSPPLNLNPVWFKNHTGNYSNYLALCPIMHLYNLHMSDLFFLSLHNGEVWHVHVRTGNG